MQQLSLSFEPGLAQKYRDIRECFAACVYQRGLGRVAAAVDVAPSNLSAMLSGDRHLPAEKDTTPAMFLAAKWLTDASTLQQQALAQIPTLMADLQRLVAVAGGAK